MIMAPTMPLNVYCMALLTCIMRDHRMQLLKYIIKGLDGGGGLVFTIH